MIRAGPLDDVALFDLVVGPEDHAADVVFLQVQEHPHDAVGKLHQLAGHRVVKPVDARDSVPHLQHGAYTHLSEFTLVRRQMRFQHLRDFIRPYINRHISQLRSGSDKFKTVKVEKVRRPLEVKSVHTSPTNVLSIAASRPCMLPSITLSPILTTIAADNGWNNRPYQVHSFCRSSRPAWLVSGRSSCLVSSTAVVTCASTMPRASFARRMNSFSVCEDRVLPVLVDQPDTGIYSVMGWTLSSNTSFRMSRFLLTGTRES